METIRIQRAPRIYFHVENLYYKFMVVFIRRMSLFLLTLVANKILSIFSWLIDCKFLETNIQSTQVESENFKIFKYLKFNMDKYVLNSNF
jgi:hypothetical protein